MHLMSQALFTKLIPNHKKKHSRTSHNLLEISIPLSNKRDRLGKKGKQIILNVVIETSKYRVITLLFSFLFSFFVLRGKLLVSFDRDPLSLIVAFNEQHRKALKLNSKFNGQ